MHHESVPDLLENIAALIIMSSIGLELQRRNGRLSGFSWDTNFGNKPLMTLQFFLSFFLHIYSLRGGRICVFLFFSSVGREHASLTCLTRPPGHLISALTSLPEHLTHLPFLPLARLQSLAWPRMCLARGLVCLSRFPQFSLPEGGKERREKGRWRRGDRGSEGGRGR